MTEDKAAAVVLTVRVNDDGTVTFINADGEFLMADGTNANFESTESDNTKFYLEACTGGYYIRCAVATYNGNPQYLEVYKGYLTVYGFNSSNAGIYTIVLELA